MVTTLRQNRSLLKHKPVFRKGDAAFERNPYDGTVGGQLDCTPAPEAVLTEIRSTMQRKLRRQRIAMIFITLALIALSLLCAVQVFGATPLQYDAHTHSQTTASITSARQLDHVAEWPLDFSPAEYNDWCAHLFYAIRPSRLPVLEKGASYMAQLRTASNKQLLKGTPFSQDPSESSRMLGLHRPVNLPFIRSHC